jgi:hypothetical protein
MHPDDKDLSEEEKKLNEIEKGIEMLNCRYALLMVILDFEGIYPN